MISVKDVTHWQFLGYGEKSTLEKEDIVSPNGDVYVIKYPRKFDMKRVNWEDINELIAAKIAEFLQLKTIEAEIVYRNGRRGCLMKHFIKQFNVDSGETGAALLSAEFEAEYDSLQDMPIKSEELIKQSFRLFEQFSYFDEIRFDFIAMNVFDILIGNQDRHPYNWQILFKDRKYFFGPLYDNGASLGWQLSDDRINDMMKNTSKMNKFFKNMKVKAGLIENKQPLLKVNHLLIYFKQNYPKDLRMFIDRFYNFPYDIYNCFLQDVPLISEIRKEFLKEMLQYRMNKIIEFTKEEKKDDF